jgi:platelet-activating factor acetylhydrolase IB subunit alpha
MALTARQKLDLHEAIHEYLLSNGEIFPRSLEMFREEAGISTSPSSGKGLLEKKWTSVVRLQKKVMELEAQITELQKQNVSVGPPNPALEGMTAFKNARGPLPHAPPAASLVGHRSPVTSIAVHPLYSLVASASEDSTVKIWDYESAQYERTLKGHTGVVNGVAFNSSGTLLASCSADMSIKLWDMKVYSCTATLRGHDHTVSAVEFSLAGDHVFSCSRDGTIKCWEISSTYCIRTFLGHLDWVKCMSISLDGEHLASGSTDHSIIVWRVSTGQALQVGCRF